MYCVYSRYSKPYISMHSIDHTFSVYTSTYRTILGKMYLKTSFRYNLTYKNVFISYTNVKRGKNVYRKGMQISCLNILNKRQRRIVKRLIEKGKEFKRVAQTYTCDNCIYKNEHLMTKQCEYKTFKDKNGNKTSNSNS